jgi:hypothetical protein
MQMRHYVLTFFGLLLLVVGLIGPMTYADDWRHAGEIAVSVGFVLSGLFLVAPKFLNGWRCGGSLPLASPLNVLGMVAGTAMNKVLTGVILGVGAGSVAVWWHCSRHRRVAA